MSLNAAIATRLPSEPPPFPIREILGVHVCVAGREEAIGWLKRRMLQGERTLVAFANTNLLNKMRERPEGASLLQPFVVFNDGIGIDVASKLLYGETFPANLNGTDFTPAFLQAVGPAARVFLFGTKREIVTRAAELFRERHGIEIAGVQDGFSWKSSPDDLVRRINASGANLLLVALGNPLQEIWIRENAQSLCPSLVIGVGALFDFTSGAVPRAPALIQRFRMEWLYRLACEPRRLGRRYTIELVTYLRAIMAQRAATRRDGRE